MIETIIIIIGWGIVWAIGITALDDKHWEGKGLTLFMLGFVFSVSTLALYLILIS